MATQRTKAKTKAVRGQERIQQLMEEFPEIDRTLIVKADVLREGIKPNADSRMIGRWALPNTKWYFSYDKEDVYRPEDATEGYVYSPGVSQLSNGLNLLPMFDSGSPWEFRYEEKGRYRLYRDGEPIEEVFFPPRPQWYDRKTSSGKPMPSVIAQRLDRSLFLVPLNYCEYAKDNLLCKYCNINASEAVKKDLGMERLVGKRDQDIYETYVAAATEIKQLNIGMSGGVLLDASKEAENYARIVRVLKRAMKDVGYEVPINVVCQALDREDQLRLQEAGASVAIFDLEVWDPRLFEIICPGKAKYVGRDRWIERILMCKDIWGFAATPMVLGIELAQPYGFKTEDEAAESNLECYEWLMSRGVNPGGIFWRPVPGTEFAGQTPPRTEYFLRMSLAHHKTAIKYGRVPLPDKPSKSGEVGIGIIGDFPYVGLRGDLTYVGMVDASIAAPSARGKK